MSLSALSQVPTYYNDVNINLTGTALKTELATKIINTHTTNLSYTPGVWNALKQTDLDPNDNTKVLLLYGSNDNDGNYITDKTRGKDDNGGTAGTQWNREHTFPKSLGDPNLQTSGPGADAHHLRATDITMNSNRGSLLFIDGSGNAGTVGSGWYPGDEWKGDVARMMMYMYLRYDSRCYPSVVTIGTTNSTDANMIDLLLEWNAEDPVSDYELQRNTALESLQGNRNPFIDNPAFATTIWGGTQAENRFNSVSDCSELFISEYIEGSGDNKFIEIYNPTDSSIDLSTYDLVMYSNGSATISATLTLSGTITSGGTFVIENSSENLGVTADLSTSNTVMSFNGDDAIALRKSSTAIDVIGQIGTDPGTQWSGTTCTLGTGDAVLRRNSTVKTGDADGSDAFNPDTEWTCSSVPDITNLGSHTNVCLTNEIDIQGNNISIVDGTTATNLSNDTNFGSITTSSGTIVKTFTILNLGGQTLTLSGNPVISGTNSSDFSLTSNPTLAINSLSSTTFSITFDPSADGTRTATITVNSDDSDEGVYTFNIEGTGTVDGGSSNCGSETFTNSNAPSGSYGDGSFTGDNSVTWTYVGSRDSETYEITGTGLMLRNTSSKVTSSTVSGGIGDFSMKLKKGFSGGGNRQVQLYINNVLQGTSISWDNTTTQDFNVSDINISGDVVIEIRNATGKQVVLDDISWTCYNTPEIDIQGNATSIPDGTTVTSSSNDTDFGTTNTASGSITKRFTILNTGGQTLTLSGNPLVTISGTNSSDFSLSIAPSSSITSSGSTTFDITFNPSADGVRTATLTINSNDDDESIYNFNIEGTGTSGAQSCATSSDITIFQQDFESSPATPTLTYTSSNTATSSGNGNTPSDPMYSNGTQGLKNSSGTASIEFNTVDVSSYSNIGFSVRLASFSGTSGNGAELSDYVKISVSTDNGTTYSDELTVTGAANGFNNARWSFDSGTGIASVAYDGNDATTTFTPAGSGARTTDGYSTINVTGIPSSANLKIKIDLKNGGGNEIWVIDDAKITGDSETTTTWNGTTWSNGTPNSTTKAIIDGNYSMSTNPSINSCECEINNGKILTVSNNKFITIEGNLINNGSIIIENNGSLVQVSSTATVSGSGLFTVSRNSTSLPSKNVFTYWSSPLTNSTLAEVVSGANNYYSFLPATQSWKSETSASSMTPGNGYITQGDPGINYPSLYTAYFTGSALNSGNINISIIENDDADNDNDWNLIGNPYASAIDADAFLAANSSTVGGTLYLWTHNTDASTSQNFSQNDYVSWNGTGGVANCGGCVAPTKNIASGQVFFVQGLNSSTATFTNAMRISGENTNFYRNENENQDKIWLNLFNNQSFNQTLIGFINGATDDVDHKYDGLRLDSGINAYISSIINNQAYSIQGKPSLKENEEIPLQINVKITGQFNIEIDHLEGKLNDATIILVDKLLNKEHDLKVSNYSFTINEIGTYNNRFVLKINTSNALNIKDIDKQTTNLVVTNHSNQLEIKTSNNKLIKDIFIYDLLGRKISKKLNNKSPRVIITTNNLLKDNILIIKVILDSGEVITKKITQ